MPKPPIQPNPGPPKAPPTAPKMPPGPFRPGKGPIPVYHKGGVVKKTGPAIVKKGEKIIPAGKAKKK